MTTRASAFTGPFSLRIPESMAAPEAEARRTAAARRFTLDGSDELEQHLDRICHETTSRVVQLVGERKLEAVFLAGGYGRGEGGVLRTMLGDRPYNDMEFYVCLRGGSRFDERQYGPLLHEAARELSALAGIDLELKVCSFRRFRRSPSSMFYYDLIAGHRLLWGTGFRENDCAHHRDASLIPANEATRLLMNRCSGLLFAREKLEQRLFTEEQADFIVRNLAKLQLALGDAVLTMHGLYHWSCRERFERLRQLPIGADTPWLEKVREHHAAGVAFKLHPQPRSLSESQALALQTELTPLALSVWLWLEGRRLSQPFTSACDYALHAGDKCPEIPRWRNHLANVWNFGPAMLLNPEAFRNPRERLLRALTLLLWEPASFHDRMLLQQLQTDLQTRTNTFDSLTAAYRVLWGRFN